MNKVIKMLSREHLRNREEKDKIKLSHKDYSLMTEEELRQELEKRDNIINRLNNNSTSAINKMNYQRKRLNELETRDATLRQQILDQNKRIVELYNENKELRYILEEVTIDEENQ